MPQMAPMSWMMLMIMFIISYIMFNATIYFFSNKKNNNKKENINLMQMNWKW